MTTSISSEAHKNKDENTDKEPIIMLNIFEYLYFCSMTERPLDQINDTRGSVVQGIFNKKIQTSILISSREKQIFSMEL